MVLFYAEYFWLCLHMHDESAVNSNALCEQGDMKTFKNDSEAITQRKLMN